MGVSVGGKGHCLVLMGMTDDDVVYCSRCSFCNLPVGAMRLV